MIPLTLFLSSVLLASLPEDSEEDDRRWAVDFIRDRVLRWAPEFTRRMGEPFPDPDFLLEDLLRQERLEADRDQNLRHDWDDASHFLMGKEEELFKRLLVKYPAVGTEGIRALTTYGARSCTHPHFGATHTEASSLVTVPTPYPTRVPVLLHPAAAASFARVLKTRGLTEEDLKSLCRINSSFRSWDQQLRLIEKYKKAIGSSVWVPWKTLTEAQRNAARRVGFAYHPSSPVDKPYTHVGGGALDIDDELTPRAIAALQAENWKKNTPADVVHWGWHGDPTAVPAPAAPEEEGFLESWLSWLWPSSSAPTPPSAPTAIVEAAPGASVELTAADGTTYTTGPVPAGTYDAVISGKQKRVTLEAGRTYRASSIGTLYG